MTNIKCEFSAGGVVYRKEDNQLLFVLGKHSGYHKWVLPKGLIEPGEKGIETAIRETEEEMGVKTRLVQEKPIHVVTYVYYADYQPQPGISNSKLLISNQAPSPKAQNSKQSNNQTMKQRDKARDSRRVLRYQEQGGNKVKVLKKVTFYLLEYVAGDPQDHGWEMEAAGWFTAQEALKKMSFEGEKEALKKAVSLLTK